MVDSSSLQLLLPVNVMLIHKEEPKEARPKPQNKNKYFYVRK